MIIIAIRLFLSTNEEVPQKESYFLASLQKALIFQQFYGMILS